MDKNLINQFMITDELSDQTRLTSGFAKNIESGSSKMIDLIQLLGDYLIDQSPLSRAKAMDCISQTLSHINPSFLPQSQISVITTFLCDRLDDRDAVPASIKGLVSLVSMTAFSYKTLISTVLTAIKSNITMRNFNQAARYSIFNLIQKILNTYKDYVCQSIPDEFIESFIHVTSGEKDPRNLMISFSISTQILSTFHQENIDKFLQDLFDVTFCYFPITFEPPKNDPYGITSNDLKVALRNTLSANSAFSFDIFSSLLEKMASSSLNIKNESITTICQCIEKYNPEVVSSHWKEIWDGLKFEVLHGTETESQTLTLKALKLLANALEKNTDEKYLNEYIQAIINESQKQLFDCTSKKSITTATLVAGVAEASPLVFKQLSDSTLKPLLENNSRSSLTTSAHVHLLEIAAKFINASKEVSSTALFPYKDNLLEFFTRSLMSVSKSENDIRVLAAKNLSLLTSIPKLLPDDEIGLIVQYFDDILLAEYENKEIFGTVLDSLVQISHSTPQTILTVSYPFFLSELPEKFSGSEDEIKASVVLRCLSRMAVNRHIFEVLFIRLFSKLDSLDSSDTKYSLAIFSSILAVLTNLFSKDKEDNSKDSLEKTQQEALYYLKKLIPLIFSRFLKKNSNLSPDYHVVISASLIILTVVKNLSSDIQEQFANDILHLFDSTLPDYKYAYLTFASTSQFDPESFTPFKADSEPTPFISFLLYGLTPVSNNISLNSPDLFVGYLKNIQSNISKFHSSKLVRLLYLKTVCLLTTKFIPESNQPMVEFINELKSSIVDAKDWDSLNSLEMLVWIAKGYIIKNNSFGFKLIDFILPLLSNSRLEIGVATSQLVEILVNDDAVINKENGATIRALYKQRAFVQMIGPIVSGFQSNTSGNDKLQQQIQVNHLVALSSLLRSIPANIIAPQFSQFFKLLLQSLSINDPKVREASINTITTVISLNNNQSINGNNNDSIIEVVSQHLHTLIPKLIEITKNSDNLNTSPQLRISALKCLNQFIKTIPDVKLRPHLKFILQQLKYALDDKYRSVRKEAVTTRQNYYEYSIENL